MTYDNRRVIANAPMAR